jgi:hypothetical protein
MSTLKWIGTTTLAGLAAVGLTASQASAQNPYFRVAQGMAAQPGAFNPGMSGQAYTYASPAGRSFGTTGNLYSNPSFGSGYASLSSSGSSYLPAASYDSGGSSPAGGYYPYTYTTVPDPYGGFLRGSADVISSQGKLLLDVERSVIIREQGRQAALQTRRMRFDEIMYERANTPTPAEEAERVRKLNLRRSQNTATLGEIWSAKALNDLLDDLRRAQGKKVDLPAIPLDEDMLRQINVVGEGGGNAGLLRNEGRFSWPLALVDLPPADKTKELRSKIEERIQAAITQAANNKVEPSVLKDLNHSVRELQNYLSASVNDLPTSQYIEAKRFLSNLEDGVLVLGKPNAGNYFNRKFAAKGKTIQDLVEHMARNGLRFAPAVAGDESAYQALHSALAAYDLAFNAQAAGQ